MDNKYWWMAMASDEVIEEFRLVEKLLNAQGKIWDPNALYISSGQTNAFRDFFRDEIHQIIKEEQETELTPDQECELLSDYMEETEND